MDTKTDLETLHELSREFKAKYLLRANLNKKVKELKEQLDGLSVEIETIMKENNLKIVDGIGEYKTGNDGASVSNALGLYENAKIWEESQNPEISMIGKMVLQHITFKPGEEYLSLVTKIGEIL